MKEAVHEHLFVPIGFSMEVDDHKTSKSPPRWIREQHTQSKSNPRMADKSRNSFGTSNEEQQRLTLPGVSVLSNSAKDRARQRRSQRRCLGFKISTWVKVAVLVILYTCYREFDGIIAMTMKQQKIDLIPPSIQHDYSNVKRVDDLSTELVKPWCYNNMEVCLCADPLVPTNRIEEHTWKQAHLANNEAAVAHRARSLDVVFYGDSITEGWNETSYGRSITRFAGAKDVFQSFFSTARGGDYEGIALGISGDTSPNLLWRLQNGELPRQLYPSVFWLLIGTNDIGKTWCSPELVVIGILRIVEEIRRRKPSSIVVINGLLPRSYDIDGGFVKKGRNWKPPLWQYIKAINNELRQYAAQREKVEYFESSAFFVDKAADEDLLRIDNDLMPDFLHPNAAGYSLWGEEIAATLGRLLAHK